jgi:xanthine dehydrogenase molybdenum-binding subunit
MTTTYEPNQVLSTREYQSVGKRPVRHDGIEKVTGKARYSADISLPGLLHGKVLRSPHAHATIKSIDLSKALALPGVRAAITAADFAPLPTADPSFSFTCSNVMARDKVLYKGHALAAVCATSPDIAEEALALIEVEYEVLPAVFSAREAMRPGAPILHPDLPVPSPAAGETMATAPNVANRFEFVVGDIAQALAQAEIIVERETTTKAIHQGYIEPHAATAQWQEDGRLTLWSSSQGHFNIRDFTARCIGITNSKIKAVPMEIGGGFGAKMRAYCEPVAALLARKAGAPVKVAMSRKEVFEGTGPTSATHIKVRIGASKDGKLTAAEAIMTYEAGAFPGSSVQGGARCIMSPYDIPNARIEGFDVVCNTQKTAAYRAPGSPAAALAFETALDELAEKLGIDPIDLRLKNCAREGTRNVIGTLMPKVGFVEVLTAAKNHPHYGEKLTGPFRGRGIASGYWGNGSGPACAVATVMTDGTVALAEGSPDIGGSRTAIAQQLAETLGIDVRDVKPQIADTDTIGYTSNTAGSGATFKSGWAAHEAAQDIARQAVVRAAQLWECDASEVEYSNAVLTHKTDPDKRMSFKELATQQNETGGPIVGRAGVNKGGAGPTIATHIVDVEVDADTGKIQILRYTAVQDAGKAIHPSYVEGQMQGGVVQGIGWALNEEYFLGEDGRMQNSSFLDYRMPTSLDLPMIDTVIVEVHNPGHPYGVRGVGEVPIVPPLAAIANAIYHAIGVRIDDLPMNPARVLAALNKLED